MTRCGARWRGQHEDNRKIVQWRLPTERNRFGRSAIEQARGPLAGEGDRVRPVAPYLFPEGRDVDGESEGLVIHARARFAEIGKADAELQ